MNLDHGLVFRQEAVFNKFLFKTFRTKVHAKKMMRQRLVIIVPGKTGQKHVNFRCQAKK